MFKRLKSRILITNMVIISVLLMGSMAAIYLSTHNGTNELIRKDIIQSMIEWRTVENIIANYDIDADEVNLEDALLETGEYKRMPWQLRVSVFARVNYDNNQIKVLSFSSEYSKINAYVRDNVQYNDEERFYFNFVQKTWAGWTKDYGDSRVYIYLDVTTKMAYLDRLVVTSILVFSATLIAVFVISLFLTNRAVKPVDIAFKKQKQFISDASHELRTPLAAIRANVDLIISKRKSQIGSDLKWMEYIKLETDRMNELTNELLYLAELEDKYNPHEVVYKFNLSDEVRKQVFGMEAVAFERNLKIDHFIEEGIEISGNKEKVAQVIVILINNAMKYANDNGTITIYLSKSRNYAVLEVENTGNGISRDEISRIFDRFYRSDAVRNSNEGSYGLGLSIAKVIVDSHGGSINCESNPEGPTKFTVRLKI